MNVLFIEGFESLFQRYDFVERLFENFSLKRLV